MHSAHSLIKGKKTPEERGLYWAQVATRVGHSMGRVSPIGSQGAKLFFWVGRGWG